MIIEPTFRSRFSRLNLHLFCLVLILIVWCWRQWCFGFQVFTFQFGLRDIVHILTYLFTYFSFLKVRKPTFLSNHSSLVSKSLAFCIKYSGFCPNFYHSFSIPSFSRIALKIRVKYIFVVFSSLFFVDVFSCIVAFLVVCVLEIRTANICRMPDCPPC